MRQACFGVSRSIAQLRLNVTPKPSVPSFGVYTVISNLKPIHDRYRTGYRYVANGSKFDGYDSRSVIHQIITKQHLSSQRQHVPRVDVKQLTWRDYDPEGGVPLQEGDLDVTNLRTIFGASIDVETGNWIIRLVNYRRQSGSLIDSGIDFDADTGITREQASKALDYLRKVDATFDESRAGITWAEEQINTLSSAEYIKRAEKLGIYRRDEEINPPQQHDEDIYGKSQLVAMKQHNQAIVKDEEEAAAARQKDDEEASQNIVVSSRNLANKISNTTNLTSSSTAADVPAKNGDSALTLSTPSKLTLSRPIERPAWVQYYEKRATIINSTIVPTLSLSRRLGPSLLATLAILYLCYVLHENYIPPPTSARLFPDIPPTIATIGGIIALQLAVAMAYRLPPLWRLFNLYVTSVPASPTVSSLFLSIWAHTSFWHLFKNAIVLVGFGPYLHEDVGRGSFLAIYIATGVFAKFSVLLTHVLKKQWMTFTIGASGATLGVVSAACMMRPDRDVKVNGVNLPLTGMGVLALAFFLPTVRALVTGKAGLSNIAYESHLAGLITGAACALGIRAEARRKKMELSNNEHAPSTSL